MSIAASRFFSLPPEQITPALEVAFFSSLKTGNDTFKKTDVRRFEEIDGVVAAELAKAFPGETLELLDVGISSGTTTMELAEALERAGADFRITATDRSFAASILDGPLGSRALVENSGHILQFEILGRPLRAWDRRLDRFTGRSILNAALRKAIGKSAKERAGNRPVELVSPRLKERPSVTIAEDDIFTRTPAFERKFHFVRAANILNLDYFDKDRISTGLGHLRAYLRGPGGLLLLVRTDKVTSGNNGTLFRLNAEHGFEVVRRFGDGSEVEDLVLSVA
ncbi:MAG: hypothetical protein KJO02_09280 [Erythrobacter sp.]|nr:hypothetical protein [Erythrobacter sp.]